MSRYNRFIITIHERIPFLCLSFYFCAWLFRPIASKTFDKKNHSCNNKMKEKEMILKKILKKTQQLQYHHGFGGKGIEGLQCTLQLV
jgi:hypothetical protein